MQPATAMQPATGGLLFRAASMASSGASSALDEHNKVKLRLCFNGRFVQVRGRRCCGPAACELARCGRAKQAGQCSGFALAASAQARPHRT